MVRQVAPDGPFVTSNRHRVPSELALIRKGVGLNPRGRVRVSVERVDWPPVPQAARVAMNTATVTTGWDDLMLRECGPT